MAKVYAELIRKGLKTIEDVPERLRAAVMEILKIWRMELRAYEKPSALSFIHSVREGGANDGCCVRNPDHQGPQDH